MNQSFLHPRNPWILKEVFTRFSRCLLLQNQTRTTSLSRRKPSAMRMISCEDGLGCLRKWSSRCSLAVSPIVVRLFLRRSALNLSPHAPPVHSASSSQRARIGFSLQAFLKLSWRFSKRQMVVWLKSVPWTVASAAPTFVCVKPSLMRRSLNCVANSSNSRSLDVSMANPRPCEAAMPGSLSKVPIGFRTNGDATCMLARGSILLQWDTGGRDVGCEGSHRNRRFSNHLLKWRIWHLGWIRWTGHRWF